MSIRAKFAESSFWVVVGNGANNLVGFAVFAVLARLLEPATIGLVAFALIFIDLGRIVVFGGLPEAVVQRREWDDRVASTCFTANILTALVFLALVAGVLGPLISAYYMPGAGIVISALAAIYVVDAGRAVHEAKLRREFRYKPLAARAAIATALSGAVGIGLALSDFGVWALVAQRLVNAVLLTLLTWRAAAWRPQLVLDREILRSLTSFIVHLTPARLVGVAIPKVPEFVAGAVLGPSALAFYRVGARGLETITQFLIAPLQQASLSAFSRVDGAKAIGEAYLRVTRVCGLAACPIYLGAAVVAPDFVRLIFGPQWDESGAIMAILAVAIGSLSLGYFIQPALTAAGQPKTVLLSTLASLVTTVCAALATVWWGVVALAAGNTAQQYVVLPFRLVLLTRTLQLSAARLFAGIAPPFLAAAAMAAAVYGLRVAVMAEWLPVVRLAASVAVGGILYPIILLVIARPYLRHIRADIVPLLPPRLRRLFDRRTPKSDEPT